MRPSTVGWLSLIALTNLLGQLPVWLQATNFDDWTEIKTSMWSLTVVITTIGATTFRELRKYKVTVSIQANEDEPRT